MCKWARKIYSSYPFSKYVDDWSISLSTNKVQNKDTNCNPTYSEKKRRIKKLLWAGKNEKAKEDIDLLKQSLEALSANYSDKTLLFKSSSMESLLAEYHLHLGNVEDALAIFCLLYTSPSPRDRG